ncbi:MAG: hypothetical protein FRX49_00613 [Trebouxia sp. A1-2]|nr:MAG: hypothetical protein FRX49_00613 [Trebouxia sp. A1-2]
MQAGHAHQQKPTRTAAAACHWLDNGKGQAACPPHLNKGRDVTIHWGWHSIVKDCEGDSDTHSNGLADVEGARGDPNRRKLVEGAQLLTTLVKVPSCVSVAVAPSSHRAAVVGATPLAQAAYVEYCFTFTVAGRAAVVRNAMGVMTYTVRTTGVATLQQLSVTLYVMTYGTP